jgi:hypothetical protein
LLENNSLHFFNGAYGAAIFFHCSTFVTALNAGSHYAITNHLNLTRGSHGEGKIQP